MSSQEKVKITDEYGTFELSKKHDDFCFKISLSNKSNTECYVEIYNCSRSAGKKGACTLLQKSEIQRGVKYYAKKRAEIIDKERDEELNRMKSLSVLDPLDNFHEDSKTYKALSIMTRDARISLKIENSIDKATGHLECSKVIMDNKLTHDAIENMFSYHKLIDKSTKTNLNTSDMFNIDECIKDMQKNEDDEE